MSHEHDHALQDAKTSNDLMRAGAQSAIPINGGAATATLAFASSKTAEHISSYVLPVSLLLYASGVFLAALALLIGSKAIEKWMISHMSRSRTEKGPLVQSADGQWRLTFRLIVAALIAFALSSVGFAVGLFFRY